MSKEKTSPDDMFQATTIRDMELLCKLAPFLENGTSLESARGGYTLGECRTALKHLWTSLTDELPDQFRLELYQKTDTRARRLIDRLEEALKHLRRIHIDMNGAQEPVAITGGEFTFCWLLPRVFANGAPGWEYLHKSPGLTLDLFRSSGPEQRLTAIQTGAADISVGPTPAVVPEGILSVHLFTAKAALLFHEKLLPKNVTPEKAQVRHFANQLVFAIRPENNPNFEAYEALERSFGQKPRLIRVDSSVYGTEFVRRASGVAVGYLSPFMMFDKLPQHVHIIPFPEEAQAQFEFRMMVAKQNRNAHVEAIRQQIINYCATLPAD